MKPNVRILILTSNPRISERKTTRGALDRTRPSKPALSRTEKARNCLSPNGLRRTAAVPAANRAFVLPSRYGMAIVEIRGVAPRIPTHSCVQRLLQLNLGASLLELSLDLLGFVLVHAFLDRLGGAFDEVLGFLEAEARDGTDFLDDFDLLLASGDQNDRELGLFFSGGSGSGSRTGNRNGGSGRHAPLFFKELCQLGGFEHGEAREVVNNLL